MVVATDVAAVARSASADALEPATLCQGSDKTTLSRRSSCVLTKDTSGSCSDFEDREKFKAGRARRASRAGFAKS